MTIGTDVRADNMAQVKLGQNAVAKMLGNGRVEVTQGEVGSYRYRRIFDRHTLAAGYSAWENTAPRERGLGVKVSDDTWAEYHESHIDFVGGDIEMVEGFGSSVGLDAEDVRRLITIMSH